MTISHDEIVSNILSGLTPPELSHCVVYLAKSLIPAGQVNFPRISIDVPWQAYIAFIDREPMANWSHSARYIFVNSETGEMKSFEVQFPPFGASQELKWGLLYKAPSVSDAAVMDMD